MATEINIKRGGYGPYKYIVTYENGEHHWSYVGPTAEHEDGAYVNNDGSLTTKGETQVGDVSDHESTVKGAPHNRDHYTNHLDNIIGDAEYPRNDDWYDNKIDWEIDKVSEHYQQQHSIRVSLTKINDETQLREIVADIEELRDAGLLDGVEKIGTATDDTLAEKHGTQNTVTAEYEPEPRDIVGNSMGYRPTITLNADQYRHPNTNNDDGVKSHGEEFDDVRHALWHEVSHHLHMREYHDAGVDIQQMMMDHDGAVWDRMHDAMNGYRGTIGDEYGAALRHDPIEFYAQVRAVELAGDDVPDDLLELRDRLEADAVLDD